MEEQNKFNAEVIKSLGLLNRQMSELSTQVSSLLKIQKKTVLNFDFVNANELSELTGESIKTIYSRVHHRQISFYKPGGKLLMFNLEEIKDWIKAGRKPSMEEIQRDA